jgi:hypothetical protein
MRVLLAAAAIALIAGPVLAAETWADGAGEEKLICKKELEIGSLVRKKKTCLTAKQWTMLREQSQSLLNRAQIEGTSKQAGDGGNIGS